MYSSIAGNASHGFLFAATQSAIHVGQFQSVNPRRPGVDFVVVLVVVHVKSTKKQNMRLECEE